MNPLPVPHMLLAFVVIGAGCYGLGRMHESQAVEAARNAAIIETQSNNDIEVANYVQQISDLEGRKPVVVTRIKRLCFAGSVRSPAGPHATAATDSAIGRIDSASGQPDTAAGQLDQIQARVAAEIIDAQANGRHLESLQAVLRPQVGK